MVDYLQKRGLITLENVSNSLEFYKGLEAVGERKLVPLSIEAQIEGLHNFPTGM